jgi:Predicted NADH:ubiquinone oxidoreductase, subunit RnfD
MTSRNERRFAPHIHADQSTRGLMVEMVLILLVLYGMAYFYYGARALLLGAVSACTTLVCDIACTRISGKRVNLRDMSALVTGLMIPLFLSASIPLYIVVTAGAFAIVVAKHPFGGTGYNVFNPAAAGVAFVLICFPTLVTQFPIPLEPLPLFPTAELLQTTSSAHALSLGGVPAQPPIQMLFGYSAGPMGATNSLVILACLIYLLFRRVVRWEIPTFFFLSLSIVGFLFPRIPAGGGLSVFYELTAGTVLLGGVCMLGDPVTSPKRDWARMAYAFLAGVVVMLFRRFGRPEEGFVFAVLLMNSTVLGFDMLAEHFAGRYRRKRRELIRRQEVQKKI